MQRGLFVCNTVYQLFVAIWMKKTVCKDDICDIIVSDHMNGSYELFQRLSEESVFEKCFYVKTYDYTHGIYNQDLRNKMIRLNMLLNPRRYIRKVYKIQHSYSALYISNMDNFAKVLFDAISRSNPCDLYLYEDGIGSYAEIYHKFYIESKICYLNKFEYYWGTYIARQKSIFCNVKAMYAFNPQIVGWKSDFPFIELEKVNRENWQFKELCNRVFNCNDSIEPEAYNKKYIFMEESYFSEGVPINDVELLNQISEVVGKDKIGVKIHPRNRINRFAEAGYTTNHNTGVPWEVIVMNLQNIRDHVFITVASSSVVNMILVFGEQIKAYSLYELLTDEAKHSRMLSGDFWNTINKIYNMYPDMINVCKSIDEIQ